MYIHRHIERYRHTNAHPYIHTYLITATDALVVTLFTLLSVIVREGVTADRQTM